MKTESIPADHGQNTARKMYVFENDAANEVISLEYDCFRAQLMVHMGAQEVSKKSEIKCKSSFTQIQNLSFCIETGFWSAFILSSQIKSTLFIKFINLQQ